MFISNRAIHPEIPRLFFRKHCKKATADSCCGRRENTKLTTDTVTKLEAIFLYHIDIVEKDEMSDPAVKIS